MSSAYTRMNHGSLIRYSPKHVWEYEMTDLYKNAASSRPLLWNLAWLSHDWESQDYPGDDFMARVVKTLSFNVESGEYDWEGEEREPKNLGYLMRLPAPEAVARILATPRLKETQLYAQYRNQWIRTIEARAKTACDGLERQLDTPIIDVSQAAEFLKKLR